MSLEQAITDHAAAIRELAAAILGRASAATINTVAGGTRKEVIYPKENVEVSITADSKNNAAYSAARIEEAETEQAVAKVEAAAKAEKAAAKNAASAAGTATAAADTQSTAGAADTATDAAQTSYDYAKDVQPLLVKVGKNRDQLVALLKSFGAAKGADIKPADYAAVIAKANELIAG